MSAEARAMHSQRIVAVVAVVFLLAVGAIPILNSATSAAAAPDEATVRNYPNFADIVANVQSTVVNISTGSAYHSSETESDNWGGPLSRPWLHRFYREHGGFEEHHRPRSMGVGSGFIIGPEGHIVTNYHVVNGARTITVTLNDGIKLPAVLIGGDEKTDLALLKVETATPLPHAEFGDSTETRTGDWVVAIGNPFGLGGSVTAGIVSARGRDIRSGPFDDYLQIDAPINRGNSGGPLFDLSGRVIGVNTAIFSPNGGSVGIGFAIPAELVQPIVEDLLDDGRVERGWLGVQIQSLTPAIAESLGLGTAAGALVAGVVSDSPAAEAGIVIGDVILAVDGNLVEGAKALTQAVAAVKPDTPVTMRLWRHGRQDSLTVKLGEKSRRNVMVTKVLTEATPSKPRIGVRLSAITPHLASRFGVAENSRGVIIVDVEKGSPAAERALKAGDIIIRIGDIEVETPGDVSRGVATAAQADHSAVLLLVARPGGSFFIAVPFS